uniref:mitogen-activated protein kinase kinase kinase n=1 Tax=Ananas comosus var. bracteatus TaxID=296719 RepID=A0A6V7PPI7_ANACO|nr:unnamed protein product [Ananas comosus var. bracteatus]
MFLLGRKDGGVLRSRSREMSSKQQQQQQQQQGRAPRLERRNAAKHVDYEAAGGGAPCWLSSSSSSSSSSFSSGEPVGLRATRSLDLVPSSSSSSSTSAFYSNQTSFRIGGSIEGEVDLLCRTLGLSGPDDFAIPVAAWEARKARSNSDLLPRPRLLQTDDGPSALQADTSFAPRNNVEAEVDHRCQQRRNVNVEFSHLKDESEDKAEAGVSSSSESKPTVEVSCLPSPRREGGADGGIRGVRPPLLATPQATASPPFPSVLALPPVMSLPPVENVGSTWDILRLFAPQDEKDGAGLRVGETSEGYTGTSSLSTLNDDDASSTTTETTFTVSPNGLIKRRIRSWIRGTLLGSGSFGTVYEAISDEGVFFAVKEVSLIDQGTNAQQCILQLEQEVALLSQFEHENIVQYYGTDKEETKLFIFLELVTQGSLASLYQKYHLRDTQVSAYTRQILNGLVYLHERSVVHRDIKCANILVHVNGSVKLADFGLAKEIDKINNLKSCKGSVYWMAPEVVNPRTTYGTAADIWSLGCTVLEMLTRQIPYPNMEWTHAFFQIGRGEQPPIPDFLSPDARDFISQCVKVNPDDRPSASQLLQHPFMNRSLWASSSSDSSSRGWVELLLSKVKVNIEELSSDIETTNDERQDNTIRIK